MMEGKYVTLVRKDRQDGSWYVFENEHDGLVGYILWSNQWKQYGFQSAKDTYTLYPAGCLAEISVFLTEINEKQRRRP